MELDTSVTRRSALGLMGGAAFAAVLAACGGGDSRSSSSSARSSGSKTTSTTTTTTPSTTTTTPASTTSATLIPEETAGPYPLDLHNNQAMFRPDITEGKTGVPLTLTLTLLNASQTLTNARVDVWHCDKDGVYSGYSQAGANTVGETFCRGIQLTDRDGKVTFTTIYPGWYSGRITHIHFQLYLNNGLAATSQLAFPQEVTTTVYNSALYRGRGQNTSVSTFSQDNVFGDGTTGEMLALTGDPSSGYTATLSAGVAA